MAHLIPARSTKIALGKGQEMHLYSKGAGTARLGALGPLGSPGKQQMRKTWKGDCGSLLERQVAGCGARLGHASL